MAGGSCYAEGMKRALTGISPEELGAWLLEQGEAKFRAAQILDWLWKKKVATWEEMRNVPKALREKLAEEFELDPLTYVSVHGSADTTRKFLFRLGDGRYVECVLIPANPALYGEGSDRLTLCVSSQVGCAYGCKFCASGLAGFTRNLEIGEISGQVLAVERLVKDRVDNLVFMGMGEPLANYANVTGAILTLTAEWGLNIGARRMTVSTSGLVPQIRQLAEFAPQIRLAISLHGATDDVRGQIMPVNRKWGTEELFAALDFWNEKKHQRLTLEYILIQGVNDAPEQARILAKHARRLQARVNLIPYNTVEGLDWERPSEDVCCAFRDILRSAGVTATLRLEKGHDISAACGQLRLKQETEEGLVEAPIKKK